MAEQLGSFRIQSFQKGVNEGTAEGLLSPHEAVRVKNVDILDGSLKTVNRAKFIEKFSSRVNTIIVYHGTKSSELFYHIGNNIYNSKFEVLFEFKMGLGDYLNFEYEGKRIVVMTNGEESPILWQGSSISKLKNRRKKFKADGSIEGYVDADGKLHTKEDDVKTYAPSGRFIELHYDRVWIAGEREHPDRVYFSTSNVNGADIQDFTSPTEEGEANMHGGFIDVRSYDGGKVIGLRVIQNYVIVWKNRSAFKIFGDNPSNYEMVQLFACDGAIADRTIVTANNGAYFLADEGIFYFDGTNTTNISKKIRKTIQSMSMEYADRSVGMYANGNYYLAIPTNGSSENNTLIVYNIETDSYTVNEIDPITCFAWYNNKLMYGSKNSVYEYGTDKTGALPMYWESPFCDFGSKNTRKICNQFYFRARGVGTVKFTLESDTGIVKTKEFSVNPTEKLYKSKLKNKGRMLKLKIENIGASRIEVTSPELIFELEAD